MVARLVAAPEDVELAPGDGHVGVVDLVRHVGCRPPDVGPRLVDERPMLVVLRESAHAEDQVADRRRGEFGIGDRHRGKRGQVPS